MAKRKKSERPAFHRTPHDQLPFDPIFFRKVDVKVGTKLLYLGRMDAGSLWEVTKIMSDLGMGRGSKGVEMVNHLADRVFMERRGDWKDRREATFGYLSYSAVWRLPE